MYCLGRVMIKLLGVLEGWKFDEFFLFKNKYIVMFKVNCGFFFL